MSPVRAAGLIALVGWCACFSPSYSDATRCGPGGACPAGRTCVDDHCVTGGSDGGTGGPLLRFDKAGNGEGEIRSINGAMLACGPDCPSATGSVTLGATVSVEAVPAPGSFFQGFTGACSGAPRSCAFDVTGDGTTTLTGRFALIERNLMFVSTMQVRGDFGGTAAADAICGQEAAAAGLQGAFVAFLSGGGESAIDRLRKPVEETTPRGFVRMDGLPVGDTVMGMFTDHVVWFPPSLTGEGEVYAGQIWTGSTVTGLDDANAQCVGWGSNAVVSGAAGIAGNGPRLAFYQQESCATPLPFLCVMVDRAVPVEPVVTRGNRIFVSGGTLAGTGYAGATTLCRQAGSASAVPLLTVVGTTAMSRLHADVVYVRPDGIRVGTGAEIMDGKLDTGIWVTYTGAPSTTLSVWTGSLSPRSAQSGDSATCGDWLSTSGGGIFGIPSNHSTLWWSRGFNKICSDAQPVYCVEP